MTSLNLTPAQQQAVEHFEGPCLVIAGAGTGKTKVITERIARLILDKKVDPEEILALTFTDKAAGEMQERLDLLLPYGTFGVTLSTFHSFCHDFLKRHSYLVGVDANARLIGKAEEVSLLRANLTKLPLKLYLPPANPVSFLRDLTKFFDRAKEERVTPQMLQEQGRAQLQAAEDEGDAEAAEKLLELAACMEVAEVLYREANILTYADLINFTLQVLQKSAHARKEEQERYRFILIDEFQDTNTSQAEIAYFLAGERANIFVVGDDDQAIYRFRGANITNILNFRDRYPNRKVVTLTDNFRSGQPILDAAYRLIQNNNPHRLEAQEKIDKRLKAHEPYSFPVQPLFFSHNVFEQEGVVQEIGRLITEEGVAPEEIAILARGHAQLTAFEQELMACGIPLKRQRDGSFYEQPAVERALSYLRFLVRPHDSYNLFFLLTEPPFNAPLEQLREVNVQARRVSNSLWEHIGLEENLAPELVEARHYLQERLSDAQNRRPTDALRSHIQGSGWEKQLIEAEDSTSLNQLNTLYFEARNFEFLHRPVVLAQYLHHVDDLIASGEDIRVENEFAETSDGVQLMTVHSSKGLEFRVVFVVNMVMDRFPSRGGSSGLPMPEDLVVTQVDQVKYEEERRLAYVAFTRAKERLYLAFSKRYESNKRDKKPSLFIGEALGLVTEPAVADQPLRASLSSTAEPPKPLKFAPPTVYTASALEAFEESPEKYLKEHVYKITQEDNAAASFGSCMHDTLHCYFAAKKSGEVFSVEDHYKKCWRPEGYENKQQAEQVYQKGLSALQEYIAKLPPDFTPDRLEHSVELILENGIKVIGKIDRIDKDPNGLVHIIDYKTGRKDAKPADVRENLPLAVYAAALAQRKEKVGSIALHYVMTGKEIPLPVDTAFHTKTLERVQGIITKIEEAYLTNNFPAGTKYRK